MRLSVMYTAWLRSTLSVTTALLIVIASGYFLWRRRRRATFGAGRESAWRAALENGTRVEIMGLKGRAELNGRHARVVDFDGERYAVELEPATGRRGGEGTTKKRVSIRPANISRTDVVDEAKPPAEKASAPAAPEADDVDADRCPLCRAAMPRISWRGNERNPLVCCGGHICLACWSAGLKRREDVGRRMAEVRKLKMGQVDRAEVARILADLEETNKCPVCRGSAPHSPSDSAAAVQRHADAGRPWALYQLATRYRDGVGVKRDPEQARQWLERAAAHPNANPNAAAALGVACLSGLGAPQDVGKALKLLRPAAEAGDAAAMHGLGQMYGEGLGVRRSISDAISWWARGAELGSHECQSDLGCCYEAGTGVVQSEEEARRWFLAAAEQGNPTAMFNLGGALFRSGEKKGAIEWCQKAARAGNKDAADKLRELGVPGAEFFAPSGE